MVVAGWLAGWLWLVCRCVAFCCPDTRYLKQKPRRGTALGSLRTYVGLLRYNFGAKRPNYLPTQLPSAASGRKTYLPTYLPIRRPPRKNLPTYMYLPT